MKFLVISRPRDQVSAIEVSQIQDTGKQFAVLRAEGKLEISYGFVNGGGTLILNVDTAEELWQILHEQPMYPFFSWQIEPLVDLTYSMNQTSLPSVTGKAG